MKKHIEVLKLKKNVLTLCQIKCVFKLFNLNVKRMNAEVIGTWAGQVWNALNESGKLTVKGLKKATKLKEKELYAALGWLAREGKVSMYEVDADIEVVLL